MPAAIDIREESRRDGARTFVLSMDGFTRVQITVSRCVALPDEPHNLQPSDEPVTNREGLQACIALANHLMKLA